jgi:Tetratricopeptide repeat
MRIPFRSLVASAGSWLLCQANAQSQPSAQSTTFYKDVAPIIFRNCSGCHRPGQPAPFSLLTYQDVKKRSRQIAEIVEKRIMPPWLPERGKQHFIDDRSLPPEQIATIQTWFQQGSVEGSPADQPQLPTWSDDWQLGKPDLIVKLPKPYVLTSEGKDIYHNFVFPIPVSERKFVKGIEFLPGNAKVVHHAFINVDSTPLSRKKASKEDPPGFEGMLLPDTAMMPGGQLLGWQPGKSPYFAPEGLAWALQTNTDLVLQLHLHPTGKSESVQPTVAFYFTTQPPTNAAFRINLNPLIIDIAPGVKDYAIEDNYKLPIDVQLIGISPHAHYLGKRLEGRAVLPNGVEQELLTIPNWDFNWQGDYRYATPLVLPKGTTLKMHFTYDNSTNNARNPNSPPKRVKYGLQTTDEMGELWFQVLPANASERAVLGRDFYKHLAQRTIEYNEHVLVENPKDAEAHTRAGRARYFFGEVDAAMAHYTAAVQADPSYDRAWYELGFAYLRQNNLPKAQVAFENVVRLNPLDFEAQGSLGMVYMQQGQLGEAEKKLRAALEINPTDKIARANLDAVLKAKNN